MCNLFRAPLDCFAGCAMRLELHLAAIVEFLFCGGLVAAILPILNALPSAAHFCGFARGVLSGPSSEFSIFPNGGGFSLRGGFAAEAAQLLCGCVFHDGKRNNLTALVFQEHF